MRFPSFFTFLCCFLLLSPTLTAQNDPAETLKAVARELCPSFQEVMAGEVVDEVEDFLLFTLMSAEKLPAASKENFKTVFGVDLEDAPLFDRPFWDLTVALVEDCPSARQYFIFQGQSGELNVKTRALPGFDSLMASTAQLLEEDLASRQNPLPFHELVYAKINFEELPTANYQALLKRKSMDSFLPAVLAQYQPAAIAYSLDELGEGFETMDKVKMDQALPTPEDLDRFCAQMQQLDTIRKDDDYLIPATQLAEAYVEQRGLSFDYASNRTTFIRHYANKIWFEKRSSCAHFAKKYGEYAKRISSQNRY
ncbi:hypothetical protein [Lewinella sp. W8]|uniref:hypothetical protein n=1 Tax=Lewinella sp. W8 TaxID=2528208 RepID=UPI0010674554|nr:hypothetical protein [Lewinella sp. W8]MTB49593.1 hypothetical protein [Lewinella sp. W8]